MDEIDTGIGRTLKSCLIAVFFLLLFQSKITVVERIEDRRQTHTTFRKEKEIGRGEKEGGKAGWPEGLHSCPSTLFSRPCFCHHCFCTWCCNLSCGKGGVRQNKKQKTFNNLLSLSSHCSSSSIVPFSATGSSKFQHIVTFLQNFYKNNKEKRRKKKGKRVKTKWTERHLS